MSSLAPLSNPEIRRLKAAAQHLKPAFKIGKAGLSPEFLRSVDEALAHNELIKVKFDEFKERRKTLAPELAEQTASHLVTLLGHVAVLYRRKRETDVPSPSPGGQGISHDSAIRAARVSRR